MGILGTLTALSDFNIRWVMLFTKARSEPAYMLVYATNAFISRLVAAFTSRW